MEKTQRNKYIVWIVGIIFIIAGLLIVLIPTLTMKDYKLYKNGEDKTAFYLDNKNDEEKYLECVYSTKNEEDSEFIQAFEDTTAVSTSNVATIDLGEIYKSNNFSSTTGDILFNINLNFNIDPEIFANYKFSEYPSISLVFNGNPIYERKTINSNYYRYNEVKIDKYDSTLENPSLLIQCQNDFVYRDENNEEVRIHMGVTRLDFEFFVA